MDSSNLPAVIAKQNPIIWTSVISVLSILLGGVILRRRG
jgi:hypothetical protein